MDELTPVYQVCINRPGFLPENPPVVIVGICAARDLAWTEVAEVETEESEQAAAARNLPERGGIIALSNGYVIDVQEVDWSDLRAELTHEEIIAAIHNR